MRKHRRHNDDDNEVDMTPMLDIVFIMLIFFIVTTSFVKESAIDINRPKPDQSEQPPSPKRPIIISINETSEIHMNEQLIDIDAIQARIEVARAKKPKASIVVLAHPDAHSGVVVRAVDQANLAGAGTVTVLKDKK